MEQLKGIKDLNIELFAKMDDRTLFNICLGNKEINKICNNEVLWRKKFLQKYGEEQMKYKPDYRTWKQHYLKVVSVLNGLPGSGEWIDDISEITWGGRFDNSYYSWKYTPLSRAPEDVLIVYRMKKYPEFKQVKELVFPDGSSMDWKTDKDLTLEEFFNSINVKYPVSALDFREGKLNFLQMMTPD